MIYRIIPVLIIALVAILWAHSENVDRKRAGKPLAVRWRFVAWKVCVIAGLSLWLLLGSIFNRQDIMAGDARGANAGGIVWGVFLMIWALEIWPVFKGIGRGLWNGGKSYFPALWRYLNTPPHGFPHPDEYRDRMRDWVRRKFNA